MAWAVGGTAATALTDARITGWLPDLGVLVTVMSLLVNLLLMRAVDDIRDADYDRARNPDRPLARGAVTERDLVLLLVAGAAVVLAINAWRPAVVAVLAAQLGYVALMVLAERRTGWPSGDALFVNYLLALPVQLLLNASLYAGLLHSTGLEPAWSGAVGVLVGSVVFAHYEFARKTTRHPEPGERTYVTTLGVRGTAVTAVVCAVAAVALLVAAARPWSPAVLVVVLPLVFPAVAALRFRRLPRWPAGLAAAFLLTGFAGPLLVNILERVLP